MLLRIASACAVLVLLLGGISAAWFFLYSRDLPDIGDLRRYAPQQATRVSGPCTQAESIAIPYETLGYNVRSAISSAEANLPTGRAGLSAQLAKTTFCEPSRMLERHIKGARVAAQIRLRFSSDEILTICANRVWFGDGQVGVEAGSQYYFGKDPNQLGIAEAALLVGLVRSPSNYSPYKHADRALQRRNAVIDAMVQNRAISAEQGELAKGTSLEVVSR